VRPEQVGLQRHDGPVPRGDAGQRVDAELLLQVHREVHRAQLSPRPAARGDQQGGDSAVTQRPRAGHRLRDVPGLRRLDRTRSGGGSAAGGRVVGDRVTGPGAGRGAPPAGPRGMVSTTAATCAGVVPQQPPTSTAPAATSSWAYRAKYWASTP
jgi:hypothetical protein